MRRHTGERGVALILLLGITATLIILASTLVMVLLNQQRATANERQHKTSVYYAEAALDNAVNVAKTKTISQSAEWLTPAEIAAAFDAASFPPGATVTYRVYDNLATVDDTITWDSNGDHMVWVEVTVTYQGKTTRMRVLMRQTTQSVVSSFPRAVLYSDSDIRANDSSDLYAVNNDGTPDTSGLPYVTSVMAGGSLIGNSQTNLAAPGTSVQSLGINVNGSVSLPGITPNGVLPPGGVGLLSDYFDQAAQADLGDEAQSGIPTQAQSNLEGATTIDNTLRNTLQDNTSTVTYNAGTTDLYYDGSLTLNIDVTNGVRTFNFHSLYVTGDLTLNATRGNILVNTTALYVGGNLTINGPAGPHQFGPLYVGGTVTWQGGGTSRLSVKTTNYTNPDPNQVPGPMYAGIFSASGAYDLVLGDTWIAGNAGTSNVAINFSAPASGTASTVLCPLLATTEKTVTSGRVDFGQVTPQMKPMTFFMQCDNDGLYNNTVEWGSSGTFYGLMVIMEAGIVVSNGNGVQPNIVGALFAGAPVATDITLEDESNVSYNQTVMDAVSNSAITTMTTVTTTVTGSWQELSAN